MKGSLDLEPMRFEIHPQVYPSRGQLLSVVHVFRVGEYRRLQRD